MSFNLADWLPLIQSLGWTLLHFLWQGALIGAGYATVRMIVPASNAQTRYAAGLVALALMAACPPVTLSLVYPQAVVAASAAVPVAADAIVVAASGAAQPGAEVVLDKVLPWLVLVWMLGVAVTAWRALRQWRALERIAERGSEPNNELERMLASLARRFKMVRDIRVLMSSQIDTPTLIGWIKPVVLMPTAVALGFPRQQVELILAHELGHLRRYDHLVNLAQAVIETLLFYHPAVHWISREVRNDREVCCDRLVLRLTEGEPREYAQTLASLEELRLASPQLAIAATGGVLLDRVRRIIDMPAPRLAATRPSLGMTLLAAAAVLIAGAGLLRPSQKDLDALAAGANAVLERLPRPDAALLVGLALREPPKWIATVPSAPRLAPIAEKEKPVAAEAPAEARSIRIAALPRPEFGGQGEFSVQRELAPVADLSVQAPKAAEAAPTLSDVKVEATSQSTSRARKLVAVHMISPRYPDYNEVKEPVRVDVQFSVNPDGSVRDVKALTAAADRAFGASAEKALAQWRFDPATIPADTTARFQQSFVFARQSDLHRKTRAGEGEEFDCVRRTGSLICRQPHEEEVALPLTIIDANATARY